MRLMTVRSCWTFSNHHLYAILHWRENSLVREGERGGEELREKEGGEGEREEEGEREGGKEGAAVRLSI